MERTPVFHNNMYQLGQLSPGLVKLHIKLQFIRLNIKKYPNKKSNDN